LSLNAPDLSLPSKVAGITGVSHGAQLIVHFQGVSFMGCELHLLRKFKHKIKVEKNATFILATVRVHMEMSDCKKPGRPFPGAVTLLVAAFWLE
jgi:hypothetical protein